MEHLDYKAWYVEAMEESNKAGYVGLSAAETIIDLNKRCCLLEQIIAEVHSWIVCAAIASPEDMAQNFGRICEITDPEFEGEK